MGVAIRVHGVGDLRVEDAAPPAPSPAEVLVRIEYGGVCGSDVHYWRDGAVGASILRAPMILGHEVVGVAAEPAADGSGPAAGVAVAVHPARSCGHCRFCAAGRPNLCPEGRYLGSAAQWPHTDGGFTTLLAVEAGRLVPVPDGLPLRRAALAEPAAVAWHAVDRAAAVGRPVEGTEVVVVGAGPIGLLIAAIAQHRGASVTIADVLPGPLDVARAIGVHRTVDAADLDYAEADVVFEASGTPRGLATALQTARGAGAVVVVGQLPRTPVEVPAWVVPSHELIVTGSLRISGELPAVLALLADPGRLDVDRVITHEFPARRAREAFETAAQADASSKVLLRFAEAS